MELRQFTISYNPRTSLKGQAVAKFIAEFTYEKEVREMEPPQLIRPQDPNTSNSQNLPHLFPDVIVWILHVDGALNKQGSRVGVLLITPQGAMLETTLHF